MVRKKKIIPATDKIDSLTCPGCGHEIFREKANIFEVAIKDTEKKTISFNNNFIWECGNCGMQNDLSLNENK